MKINVRLLIILIVVGLVVVGSVFGLYKFQRRNLAGEFLNRAQESAKLFDSGEGTKEDFDKAIKHYESYLGLKPSDIEIRAEYGLFLKERGRLRDAEEPLRKALRSQISDETREKALKAMTDIMLRVYGRPAEARDYFEELIELNPKNLDYQEDLAQCLIAEGDKENYEKAEQQLLEIIKKDPARLSSYQLLNVLYRDKLEHPEEAEKIINQMVDSNPENGQAYQIRAVYFFFTKKDEEKGEADLERALKEAPEDPKVLAFASRIRQMQGSTYKAEKLNKALIKAAPNSPEGYLQMALLEQKRNNLEAALKMLKEGISKTNDNPLLIFYKADFLIEAGKLKEARQAMNGLIKLHFPGPFIAYLKARINYVQGNWAAARGQFKTLLPDLKNNDFHTNRLEQHSKLFLGECLRQLGDVRKGAEYTKQARGTNSSLEGKNPILEGRTLRHEGKLNEAITHFKKLISINPDVVQIYVELMPLLLQRELTKKEADRNWSEVDEILAKAMKTGTDDPRIAKIRSQAVLAKNREDYQKAETILDEAVKRANTRAKQWKKLLTEVKDAKTSEEVLQLLDAASGKWAKDNYYLKKARELAQKGDINTTMKALQAGEKVQSDTRVLWQTRVAMAWQQKDLKRAEKITREAIRTVGDSATFRKMLANIIINQDKEKAPARLETIMQGIDKLPKNQQKDIQVFLAKRLFDLGKKKRALDICEDIVKKNPNDLSSHVSLFAIALKADNQKVMDKALDQIGQIEQDERPTWNFLTAKRMTYSLMDKTELTQEDRDTIETAIDYLRTAQLDRPDWGEIKLLLSKLLYKTGESQESIDHLIEAVRLGQHDPAALSQLAQYYMSQGRDADANEIFKKIKASHYALSPQGLIAIVNMKLRQKDPKGAMQELKKAVDLLRKKAKDSKEVGTYIKLSNLLHSAALIAKKLDQLELADAYDKESRDTIVKASEVDPSNYISWLLMALQYKDQGNNDKIEEMIANIKKHTPEATRSIALAKCYEALNRTVEAELACKEALKNATEENRTARQVASFYLRNIQKNRGQYNKAKSILQEIVDGKLPASQNDRTWARLSLAKMLLPQKSQKDRMEAMRLIKQNLKEQPNSLVNLRLQARALGSNGTRKGKQQAIKILEGLDEQSKLNNTDRYTLARLYWLTDNWNEVDNQMLLLLSAKSPDLQWYGFYTRCLIDRKEFPSAQRNLGVLKDMAPHQFGTVKLEARLYAGTNQPDKAIAALVAFTKDPKSEPDNKLKKLELVGETFEKLADTIVPVDDTDKKIRQKYLDQAEKYYRLLAQKSRKHKMKLVSFLGRAGKRDEAISLAEESWKITEPFHIGSATIRLINTGKSTPAQIKRIEKILEEAKKYYGDNIYLKLAKAELYSLKKQYDETEKLYQEVLEEAPKNLIALNNMAVFYALRKKQLDKALKAINQGLDLAGPMGPLLDSRSSVYYAQKKYQKALDDIDTALQEEKTGVRLFHQAQIQWAVGDKENARKSFQEALDIGLQAEQLQPLERPAFLTLRAALSKS